MQLRSICVAVALSPSLVSGAPPKCDVPGPVVHWVADFCMYQSGTDDFYHPDVQACYAKKSKVSVQKECHTKLALKRGICSIVVKNGSYDKSVEACVRDRDFSGPAVANGGL